MYENLPEKGKKTSLNIQIIEISSTPKTELTQSSNEKYNIQQKQSNIVSFSISPKKRSDSESSNKYATPKTTNCDSTFFGNSTNLIDSPDEYSDIGGIINEQSLILAPKNQIEPKLNEDNNTNKFESVDNMHSLEFEINVENQTLKLPLKEVAKLVPEFDGENISADEYIDKLKDVKGIIHPNQERILVQILKMKLGGEVGNAMRYVTIDSMEGYITALRTIYPCTEDLYTLYGELNKIVQKTKEPVLRYANRIKKLGAKILEIKNQEEGITVENLEAFKNKLQRDMLHHFRTGLKQEIRIEIGEQINMHMATIKGIEIENLLERQKILRDDEASIPFNYEKLDRNRQRISDCQICLSNKHEAMFCTNAGCVYCKNEDHISYDCTVTDDKLEIICRYCSLKGHSIDACNWNLMQGNHCQYCQGMGHIGSQCPIIKRYKMY